MIHEAIKEENEINLDLKEEELESKFSMEVVLRIIPQSHSYPLHFRNLRIEVNITKEGLLSFQMIKLRNKATHDMFSIDASYLFLGRPLKSWPQDCFS